MKVMILATDARLGVTAGEVYEAKRYRFDPEDKVELIARDGDGFDPCCTQYRTEVAHMIQGEWHTIKDGRFVPMHN